MIRAKKARAALRWSLATTWAMALLCLASGVGAQTAPAKRPTASQAEFSDWPAPLAQALAASGLPASAWSVWVQPLDDAAPRLAVLPDTPRRMASVMKLITTGVALRTLGPAFTWETPIGLGGKLDANGVLQGDLWVRASGDPSLDATRLRAALQQWRDAGLREIRGDLVVDRRLMALPPHDPAAFDAQPWRPYNAAPEPWLLAHQAVTLQVRPDLARPGQAQISLMPALAGVALRAKVSLNTDGPCGAWREALTVQVVDARPASSATPVGSGPLPERTLDVKGRYPLACGAQNWPLLWPQAQPLEHSARVWQAAWEQLGGSLGGRVREGAWPEGQTPWLSWTSPTLAEVIRDINKFSNNVMARQLLLALGDAPEGTPWTLERARTAVAQHVRDATARPGEPNPCEGPALVLDNGAGLSRTEGASARCMARWITVMWADPTMPEWLASLPLAGVDGTAKRLRAAVGRAHLKTGSLDDVSAMAGVVQDAQGRRIALVAVLNDPRTEAARPVWHALLTWAVGEGAAP